MASTLLSLIILVTLNIQLLLLLLPPQTQAAQTSSAPAPAPAGPVNLTGILDKNGQYTTFIRLLTETQVVIQLENQLNTSSEGLTIFAPTDNAFNNLKSGAINDLSPQEKVQLLLYHVSPKYYRLIDLLTVTNPVRTQAAGNDGNWGLNFTGHGNQVNVTTGIVTTQINNALRQQFPLGLYQVDMVLLPEELFGAKPPASAPPPEKTPSTASSTTTNTSATASPTEGSGAGGRNVVGWGLSLGLIGMLCMGSLT